ncbi:MAG: hypothetical protein IPP35_06325 [Elusimicrobia bacterium]|nr:hypothetical protein [Elusimicrobiota bacterium]
MDDLRSPPPGWLLARTVQEALSILEAGGAEEVSLDYFIGNGEGGNFLPVAHFIAQMPESRRPRRVRIHTASDAGASALARALAGAVVIKRD